MKIQIKKLRKKLEERNIELKLSDSAVKLLAEKGYDSVYGARPLKRAIQKYIENPLSIEILKGKFSESTRIKADVEDGELVFNSK